MKIVGIDLSGPANSKDTSLVILQAKGKNLSYVKSIQEASDYMIYDEILGLTKTETVIIGLDAPLSYNIGGGDRESDYKLRMKIIEKGMPSGSVMTPTMTRMAYLTLRGISISRCLETIDSSLVKIVEVHPGATFALRGAPINDARGFRHHLDSRLSLLKWLENQGMIGVIIQENLTDHYVAACGGALAAWHWHNHNSVWIYRAKPPYHPYDFAC